MVKAGTEVIGNISEVTVKPAIRGWGSSFAKSAAGSMDDIFNLSKSNINNSGKTVLGHFPGYIEKAKKIGGSYFDIGKKWDSLTDVQRWNANQTFLDEIASQGDEIFLSVPKNSIRPGSWLQKEVQHLTKSRGYKWINQWKLIK